MATVVLPEATRALYPFQSRYFALSDGYQMHFVDEGPEDGETLVFLHGYPVWSFVFRALIAYYAALGFRCVAVDYVGCGLSDKPTQRRYHSLRHHADNLIEFLTARALRQVTLIMEDWGGPLGLLYALQRTETVRRLVIMNSWAFQDTYPNRLHPLISWATRPGIGELLFSSLNLAFNLGVQRWTARRLPPTVMTAYKAPFRERRHRSALVQFPRMINTTSEHPSAPLMREIEAGLPRFKPVPTLILWGAENPLFTSDVAEHWKILLPRAQGPVMIPCARHFLAEDAPDLLTRHLDAFLDGTT